MYKLHKPSHRQRDFAPPSPYQSYNVMKIFPSTRVPLQFNYSDGVMRKISLFCHALLHYETMSPKYTYIALAYIMGGALMDPKKMSSHLEVKL